MLSIGAFSKISEVSPNALRYYDEIGLIKPAHVNTENGYRYYDVVQLQTILLINKLKSYHLSLEEIADILRRPEDDGFLLSLMHEKRKTLQQTAKELAFTLKQMDQDIENLERGIPIMSSLDNIKVELIETEPQTILFVRKMMSTKDTSLHLFHLLKTIEQEKLTIAGPPLTVFHIEDEFDPECYDNEVAIPIKEAVKGTRPLSGGLCAKATLHGPYTELAAVYAKLEQWLEKENYTLSSEPYEMYVTDPSTTAPEENITEIYYPLKAK